MGQGKKKVWKKRRERGDLIENRSQWKGKVKKKHEKEKKEKGAERSEYSRNGEWYM